MTFYKLLFNHLLEFGMSETQAIEVMSRFRNTILDADILGKQPQDYPEVVFSALLVPLRRVAFYWLDQNKPNA